MKAGFFLTVTNAEAGVPLQEKVYVIVEVGLTDLLPKFTPPVVKFVAVQVPLPLQVSVVELPSTMRVGLAERVTAAGGGGRLTL